MKGSLSFYNKRPVDTHSQIIAFLKHRFIPQHFCSPSSAFQSAGLRLHPHTQAHTLVRGSWLYSLKCMNKGLLQSKCVRVSYSVTPLKQARREIDHDSEK